MILTAHQPSYLPWLGLFAKILLADEYCIFDSVQYSKKGFDNRNRILTAHGVRWLSVPVESANHREKSCKEIKICSSNWPRKHIRSIAQAYGNARYFDNYMAELENLLAVRRYERLAELNEAILIWGMRKFEIDRRVVRASDFDFKGRKSELVLDMCHQLGASSYIFGGQGRSYADLDAFERAGVEVGFLDYRYPVYDQGAPQFVTNLSFIDILFHEGPASASLLRQSAEASLSVGEAPHESCSPGFER